MTRKSKVGILVEGDAKGAKKALDLTAAGVSDLAAQTSKQAKKINKSSQRIVDGFSSVATKAAAWGAATVTAGVAATAAMVKVGLTSVDALAKTSDKLGLTTESLAKFRFAAEQTGVANNEADIALQRFTRRLADAAAGSGPAVAAFKALNIEASDLIELSPDRAFAKVADQMNKVENQSQKVSLAFKLFDSGGVNLVNTLALGSKGLAELGNEADILGLTLSRVDAAKVEAANDSMNRIKKAVSGLSQQLAIKFAPLLKVIADRMFGVAKESGGMANVATKGFNAILGAVGKVLDVIRFLQIGWKKATLGVQKFALGTVSAIDSAVEKTLKIWQKLPWTDQTEYNSIFESYKLSMVSAIEEGQAEIEVLMDKPLSSVRITEFAADLEREYTAAAAEIVAANGEIEGSVISVEDVTESLAAVSTKTAVTTENAAKKVATVWDNAITGTIERLDGAFASAWKGAFDGFDSFADGLKESFKTLLAELAHQAITRPIIMQFSTALEGGSSGGGQSIYSYGAAAYKGLQAGGFGGAYNALFGGGVPAVGTAGSTIAGPPVAGSAAASSSLGSTAASAGMLALIIGVINTATDLYKGNYGAGDVISGQGFTNKYGDLDGIGEFIQFGQKWHDTIGLDRVGDALNEITGFGSKGGHDRVFQNLDFANATQDNPFHTDSGKHGESEDAASAITSVLQTFAGGIGGSSFAGEFNISRRTGIRYNGEDFEDVNIFISKMFDEITMGADHLSESVKGLIINFEGATEQQVEYAQAFSLIDQLISSNPITDSIELFEGKAISAAVAISNSRRQISGLAADFDGTAKSSQALAAGLSLHKAAAFEFAAAIQEVGRSISEAAVNQARSIRDSVLTQEQVYSRSLAARDKLLDRLNDDVQDPERVADIATRILELNAKAFGTLAGEAALEQSEEFATIAELTDTKVQEILGVRLEDLTAAEGTLNDTLSDLMTELAGKQNEAADTQLAAAGMFNSATILLLEGLQDTFNQQQASAEVAA